MEAIIFIGIQATGKSTFYKQCFVDTHIRVNPDMLKTRHREQLIFHACLEAKQSFVLDAMNLTYERRSPFITVAKQHRFRVIGYYFQSVLSQSIERNRQRGANEVPLKGLLQAHRTLQLPDLSEGFDQLFYVSAGAENRFNAEVWNYEI